MKMMRLFLVLLGLLAVAPLHAATFTVTNTNDANAGSLRQALQDAAFNGETDTIVFAGVLNGATVFVSGFELVNNNNDGGNGVTVDASALSAGITIRRSGTGAILYNDGIMTLRAVTFTAGSVAGGAGGAVANYGTMTLERCTLSGNSAALGGAIFNNAALTLRQCTVAGNSAPGGQAGAIYNFGTATLIHCTVFGNTAPTFAGLYNANGGVMVLENSIVAENVGPAGDDVSNAGSLMVNGANIVSRPIAGNSPTGTGIVDLRDPELAPLGNYGGPTQTLLPLSTSQAIDAAVGSAETIDQRGKARPIDGDLSGSAVADIGSVEFASSNADLTNLVLSAGTLSPIFDGATIGYTASVPFATVGITVTPTRAHGAATITVQGDAVASGSPSGNIVLNEGANPIAVVVTAQDGSMKTYTVTVTRLSNNANLSSLVLSAGTLTPVFASGTIGYTATVSFEVESITVTPTAANADATIKVQNITVASGSASGSIALDVGVKTITIDVTAQDGTPKTYTVNVTRQANASLAALSLSAGTLSPAFASATTSYTAFVSNATTSITVTPTAADANATITVNGTSVVSGSASDPIALNVGGNTITTVVAASDGTPKTYTVNVIRPYLVSINGDSGVGSLRQAVLDAANNPGPDVIVFDPALSGQTITLTSGVVTVASSSVVTIDASTLPDGLTISANNASAILLNQGTAVLAGLKLTGVAGTAGAVFNTFTATLTLMRCTLSGNTTSGVGGAVTNAGIATLDRCTLSGNTAGTGGALFNVSGATMTLRQCTIAGNTGTSESGAIRNDGTVTLIHCTVFGNTAPFFPGITNNTGRSLVLENSIVAGHGGNDIGNFGTVTANGVNIVEGNFGGTAGSGAVSNVEPQLAALGEFGGPTQTKPPLSGSPAIDAAVGSTETTDQRDRPRPIDGDVSGSALADIGAVEFASSNADLTNLVLSVGTLTPGFAAATTSYTARVSNDTASLTLTPTAAHAGATIAVNTTPVVSGNATGDLALNVGANNVFTILVTAQDGTPKTYILTVTRNTLPTAPNGTATATTGDQKTITLPFTSPDADGDTVTLTGTTPGAHLTINTTSGADVTFTPATDYVGDTTIGYAVSDGNGGTASGTITVTISDNDAPVIAAHANVSVFATDLGGIVVNYAAATAMDNVTTGPLILYSQDSGTLFPLGTTTVTVEAEDDAGNRATPVTFDVTVNLTAPVNTTIIAKDMDAPGQGNNGLPADAVIASFGVPATDDDGDLAFIAKWTTPGGAKGTGLFLNNTCLAIVGGDAAAATGIAGAKWKSFSDPVVAGGYAACIAKLSTGASAVVSNLGTGSLLKLALSGETGTDDGAKFKSFKAVAVVANQVAFLATLANGTGTTPKTTAATDTGVWMTGSAIVGLSTHGLALREGDALAGRTIKTLVSFLPGNGSPGCGRGYAILPSDGGDPQVSALATFTDKTKGVIFQDVDENEFAVLSLSGDAATGVDNGATFASYGPPARNSAETTVFRGTLTIANGVTKADASGIFTGPDVNGKFKTIIRTGVNAAQGAKFSALKDAVLSEDGAIAFPATIKGGAVKGAAMQTLWWKPAGGALALLAQGGARPCLDLPADAQWKAFTSLAIAGGGRGPIFAATLVPGKGNVLKTSASGVWACDFTGAPRLLFRTGVPDAIIAGRTLKSFTLLKASVGSTGVTRSFNDAAQVVWLATFTNKTTAIIRTEVP